VSVVIPAYNRVASLPRALASALDQNWPLEVIVVDDGSTDGTGAAVARFTDPRIRYERHPHNLGAATARNRGIAAARHDWIALLDADDAWLPRKLAVQMPVLLRDPHGRQLGYHTVIARGPGWGFVRPRSGLREGERVGDYLFRRGGLMQTSSLCVRREHLLAHGFDPALACHQDWDLCLRLEAAGFRFTWVAEPLGVWDCTVDPGRLSRQATATQSAAWVERRRAALSSAAHRSLRAELAIRDAVTGQQRWSAFRLVVASGLSGATPPGAVARLVGRLLLPPRALERARRVRARLGSGGTR
jgi:hypothetical protein